MVAFALAPGDQPDGVALARLKATLETETGFLTDEARDIPEAPADTLATVVARVALLLQRSLYWPVRFHGVSPDDPLVAAFETRKATVGRKAAEVAIETVAGLLSGKTDAHAFLRVQFAEFQRRTATSTPAFDTLAIAARADERGIPWEGLPRAAFVRFGHGRHAKMLYCSESSDAPLMAKRVAKAKPVASSMLERAGLPVAKFKTARSIRGAIKAARKIGGPVVVKPAKGRQGKGVTVGPRTALEIGRAVRHAQKVGRTVQIERLIPGEEYRLLVIGNQFVAAARRRAARVVGDGVRTVAALVEAENAKPRRIVAPRSRLSVRHPIKLDRHARGCLADQSLNTGSVPETGRVVTLRRVSNVSQGGDTVDVTDEVHPSVRKIAERAARLLKLDVCGVDFITTDITKPQKVTGGAICELNTQPGLSMHMIVEDGTPRAVDDAYISLLFPEKTPVRPPIVVLLDPDRRWGLRRAIEDRFRRAGLTLGVLSQEGRKHGGRARSDVGWRGDPLPPSRLTPGERRGGCGTCCPALEGRAAARRGPWPCRSGGAAG